MHPIGYKQVSGTEKEQTGNKHDTSNNTNTDKNTMNLSTTVKSLRRQYGLTQADLSLKSGVGLRFVRDLEQGKDSLRLDKVNQLLDFFNYEMVAAPKSSQR